MRMRPSLTVVLILLFWSFIPLTPGETAGNYFTIALEQDGQTVPIVQHVVQLKKKEFTLVVTFHNYKEDNTSVRLKANDKDTYYSLARQGIILKELADRFIVGAAPIVPEKNLWIIQGNTVQNLYHDGWRSAFHRTTESGSDLIARRTVIGLVANRRGAFVEDFPGNELYLVFLRAENEKVLQQDYIKIDFSPLPSSPWPGTLPADDWLQLAKKHQARGEHKAAAEAYALASQVSAALAEAYVKRGNLLYEAGIKDEALSEFEKAVERNAADALTYARRGDILHTKNKLKEATESYTAALAQDPSNRFAYSRRAVLAEHRDWDSAIADYSRLMELEPDDDYWLSRRAFAYKQSKKTELAIADYTRAIAFKPRRGGYYQFRGKLYEEQGKLQEALADYSKSIELKVLLAPYEDRGKLYQRLGMLDKAIDDFNRAIEHSPNYYSPYQSRSIAYFHLGQWQKAIADSSRAIQLHSRDVTAYHVRGLSYQYSGQRDRAMLDFNTALSLSPRHHSLLVARARLHLMNKNLEQALADANKAVASAASYAAAYYTRGQVLEAMGQSGKALEDYNKSIFLAGKSAAAHTSLLSKASLLIKLGRKDEARQTLETLLQQVGVDSRQAQTARRILDLLD